MASEGSLFVSSSSTLQPRFLPLIPKKADSISWGPGNLAFQTGQERALGWESRRQHLSPVTQNGTVSWVSISSPIKGKVSLQDSRSFSVPIFTPGPEHTAPQAFMPFH